MLRSIRLIQVSLIVAVALVIFLLGLWINEMNKTIGWNYVEESMELLDEHNNHLINYIQNRRDYSTDLEAFRSLGLINDRQFDGKYEPWISTSLGLVRFDNDDFIVAICRPGGGINRPECPENL